MRWSELIWICAILSFSVHSIAQVPKQIILQDVSNNNKDLMLNKNFVLDSFSAIHLVNQKLDSLTRIGYLAAYWQDYSMTDSSFIFNVDLGLQYIYKSIDCRKLSPSIMQKLGLSEYANNLSVPESYKLINTIAQYFESEGFQYVKVFLDSTSIVGQNIFSRINVNTGEKVFIDSIYINGSENLARKFIQRILPIQSGDVYTKKKVEESISRIKSFSFLELSKAPQISFYGQRAFVSLEIKEKKQSRVDALLGLLPGSPPDNALKLNGTFNAFFVNQFKAGESVSINFQSLQNSSQQLKSEFNFPLLFNLPFSPSLKFNLYRRDSLFLDARAELGGSWLLNNNTEFKILFGSLSSSILKPDLNNIKVTKKLPNALDTKQTFGTAIWNINKLSNGNLSRRGFAINTSITGFFRKILPNELITSLKNDVDTSFSFASLYTPISKAGYATEINFSGEWYLSIKKYSTLYNNIRFNSKNASTPLQINEMYRIGGFSLLRGFDEESIFTTRFTVLKTEYRLMTGTRSYLFAHNDLALARVYTADGLIHSKYWSLGAGIVVDTSLGLLSVSTSVGRKLPDDFDFRSVKLHVGYVGYF